MTSPPYLYPATITTGPRRDGAGRSRPGRLPRLLRGPAADPRWARPALLALLALTALLYAAGLSRNGWANDFYSAAVQAGTRSWKAFFFGSFDSSSFITVDKTPASLWVMELSARVFGLNYWSVLLPQAAEGVASAAVLYAAVRRWSGPAAGLIAAAVLATTPVATLMFRFNNPDALPSLAEFKNMVAAHDVHYFIGANGHTFGGGSGDAAQITSWVQAHFTRQTVGGVTVYNLARPASS